ncbi:extracellular solute-binding protein [Acidocella sp.]|uniref:extracellular solute-binding protein n=1 Tax=Acidocella sp. TaxID=50710 RepID=UPI0025B9A916|nr:extracellular solute-binding protein [Acidocella sp.]
MERITRRSVLGGVAAAGAAVGLAEMGGIARAATPALPTSPVSLSIVDVAGTLALTRPAFDAYLAQKPHLVSKIVYSAAPAPELPGKLKAEQSAGRLDIDMVLTGIDALSAGIKQKIWQPLLPNYAASLPDPASIYQPNALRMQGFAENQALEVVFCPAGPLLEYNPAMVATPPTTVEGLLAWAQANPKKLIYARPANSGPARIFLMGLPYLLGDSNPRDPRHGWDKTWSYLAQLGKTIEYYPSGTGAVMQELGSGLRAMTPTQTGWDINPRALGVVPASVQVTKFDNQIIVCDAQYMAIPKGVKPEKLAVLLDLMNFMLAPAQQAVTYDAGYFYPGPAVKNVPLSMAPASSQQVIQKFGRPWYDEMIATAPTYMPLSADDLVYALGRWDQQIGVITA